MLAGAGALAETQGDYAAAEVLLDAALAAAEEWGDRRALASARLFRGLVAFDREELAAAEALCQGALAEAEEIGDRWTAAVALAQLGLVALRQQAHGTAAARSRAARGRFRELGNGWGAAVASGTLATVELDRGDLGAMRRELTDSLAGFREIGDVWGVGAFLEVAARGAMAAGDATRAARLFGAATRLRAGIGAPLKAIYRAGHEVNVGAARDALGVAAFDAAWAAGGALSVAAAIAEATAEPARTATAPVVGATKGPGVSGPGAGPETRGAAGTGARLTPRELDVLRLVAEGRSDREIGDALFIGHRTVATHVANILAKLAVPSRTAAATRAIRGGLV